MQGVVPRAGRGGVSCELCPGDLIQKKLERKQTNSGWLHLRSLCYVPRAQVSILGCAPPTPGNTGTEQLPAGLSPPGTLKLLKELVCLEEGSEFPRMTHLLFCQQSDAWNPPGDPRTSPAGGCWLPTGSRGEALREKPVLPLEADCNHGLEPPSLAHECAWGPSTGLRAASANVTELSRFPEVPGCKPI